MNWNAFQHAEEQNPVGQKPWETLSEKDAPISHRVPIGDGLTHVLTMDCACTPWKEEFIVDEQVMRTTIYHNPQDGRSNLA